jgi:hypothetical protein
MRKRTMATIASPPVKKGLLMKKNMALLLV